MAFDYQRTFLRSALAKDPYALGDIGPEDVLRIESEFPELFASDRYTNEPPANEGPRRFQRARPTPPVKVRSAPIATTKRSQSTATVIPSLSFRNVKPQSAKPLPTSKSEDVLHWRGTGGVNPRNSHSCLNFGERLTKSSNQKFPERTSSLASTFHQPMKKKSLVPVAKTSSKLNVQLNRIDEYFRAIGCIKPKPLNINSRPGTAGKRPPSGQKIVVEKQAHVPKTILKPSPVVYKKPVQRCSAVIKPSMKPIIPSAKLGRQTTSIHARKTGSKDVALSPFSEMSSLSSSLLETPIAIPRASKATFNVGGKASIKTDNHKGKPAWTGESPRIVPSTRSKPQTKESKTTRISSPMTDSSSTSSSSTASSTDSQILAGCQLPNTANVSVRRESSVASSETSTAKSSKSSTREKQEKLLASLEKPTLSVTELEQLLSDLDIDISLIHEMTGRERAQPSLSMNEILLQTPNLSISDTPPYTPKNVVFEVDDELDIIPSPDTPRMSSSVASRRAAVAVKDSPAGANPNDVTDCSEISDFVLSTTEPSKTQNERVNCSSLQKEGKDVSPMKTPILSSSNSNNSKCQRPNATSNANESETRSKPKIIGGVEQNDVKSDNAVDKTKTKTAERKGQSPEGSPFSTTGTSSWEEMSESTSFTTIGPVSEGEFVGLWRTNAKDRQARQSCSNVQIEEELETSSVSQGQQDVISDAGQLSMGEFLGNREWFYH